MKPVNYVNIVGIWLVVIKDKGVASWQYGYPISGPLSLVRVRSIVKIWNQNPIEDKRLCWILGLLKDSGDCQTPNHY